MEISNEQVLRFALPALGIWICNPLMSLIDTSVVGQTDSLQLAALGKYCGNIACENDIFV
jgi:Na+-driven multidrug efflux pump